MTDRSEQLEAELAGMRPRAISPALAGELFAAVAEPAGRSWSDRLLMVAMSAGALAACVIVGVLATEPAYTPPSPGNTVPLRVVECPDNAYAFARAAPLWGDVIN